MATLSAKLHLSDSLTGVTDKDSSCMRQEALALSDVFARVAGGMLKTTSFEVLTDSTSHTAASGTVTLSGASGTVGATINGVAITVVYATSDTNTASLLKAAINASSNALVSGIVTATSSAGVVTITAVEKGKLGNCVTLAASGTGATASGARLTGGAGGGAHTSYTT